MNENAFDKMKVPADYAFCFNELCPMRERCVRYVAGQQAQHTRLFGPAVYPWALRDGKCELYRECKPVQIAWGFGRFYDHLPFYLHAKARSCVRQYFSAGYSTYYRYHNGERKLSPQQQQDVIAIVMSLGSTQEPLFDHYDMAYDFS